MPFLRFSRDKRGYEHFYLMQPPARRGKSRPHILYWFRTPPNVKVGREPFAEHVRRGLEAQNPEVSFDWDALVATPIPPPDTDRWRERRRAERAAKLAAKTESVRVEVAEAVEGGQESLAVSAPEGSEPAEGGREPLAVSAPPDTERRRRRRRRGRRRAQRSGHEAAPVAEKPEGEK